MFDAQRKAIHRLGKGLEDVHHRLTGGGIVLIAGPSIAGTVSTLVQLNAAIEAVDSAGSGAGAQQIDINSTISVTSALVPINLSNGVSLTISGTAGAALDGGGSQQGLFIYSGDVTVESLTLENMKAQGGAGSGGGGGAGLGGGLFVAGSGDPNQAVTPNVTLINVSFQNDQAVGHRTARQAAPVSDRLDRGKCHLCFEGRCMVPTRSSRHGLS
jgi:hypothetical protein